MNTIPFAKSLVGVGVAIALATGSVACSDGTSVTDSRDQSTDMRTGTADTALTGDVQARLMREELIESSDIQVTSSDGVVTLRGAVDSSEAKSAAEDAARSVDGVTRVDNQIVAAGAGGRMGDGQRDDRQRSDGQQGAWQRNDDQRDGRDAQLAQRDGQRDDSQRGDAEQAGSDTWITTKVKSMLMADHVGQGLEINVETRDGVVSLEGALDNQEDIRHVSDIARDVEGVREVNADRLVVAGQAQSRY